MAEPGGRPIQDFFDVVRSADEAARAGRMDEALEIYDLAAKLARGHGLPFTRKAVVQLRRSFGEPPAPRAGAGTRPAISMSALGSYGQFGNQLLQYAFLRLYAREHGLEAQAPDWVGRDLFELDDPLPAQALPVLDEAEADFFASLARTSPQVFAGADIKGYFCTDMRRWGARREAFRALFAPAPKLRPLLERALEEVRRRGRTVVGIHIRRGDFGYGRYWIAPEAWYAQWLAELWPRLEAPVLFVASDDPGAKERLARFSPLAAADLGVSLPGAEFFLDHWLLRCADHLAIANSCFSFTAALLNESAAAFARPDPRRRALVPFEPWASPVLIDAPAQGEPRAAVLRLLRPGERVVYVGEYCSAWTNAARAAHPGLTVTELEPQAALDAVWARGGFETIDHLVIGEECDAAAVVEGARESLDFGRIAAVHYCAGGAAEAAARLLRESGFTLSSLDAGNYVARAR